MIAFSDTKTHRHTALPLYFLILELNLEASSYNLFIITLVLLFE